MTKPHGPDLHRAYQDAAGWAEFRAQFVAERDAAVAERAVTPLSAKLRIGALISASALAVLVSAVGIPQYLSQRNQADDSVSLAAQSEQASKSPRKSATTPAAPNSSDRPSTSVSATATATATPATGATAGSGVREVTIVFTRKSPTDPCGEFTPRSRSVSASMPIAAALRRLTLGPSTGEKARGFFSAVEDVSMTTKREPKKFIVDLEKTPSVDIPPDCRTRQVDEVLTKTVKPLLGKNDSLIIRISGSELNYQKYLNPPVEAPK